MAARTLKRPEDVVEAALREVPAKGPTLEIATRTPSALVRALRSLDVVIDGPELERQLVAAGFTLNGSVVGRRRAAVAAYEKVAAEVAGALAAGAGVFWVGSAPGPELAGPLDSEALRAAGLADGLLNVGTFSAVPGLVGAALLGWARSAGRRLRTREAWVVTGGPADAAAPSSWQSTLQRFADDADLTVHVRHLPAGVFRWTRPRVSVAEIHTVLPSRQTTVTSLARVYARRPARTPPPVPVDVKEAAPVAGRRAVKAEGRPASRRYRISPRA